MTRLHYRQSIQEVLDSLARLDEFVGPTELVCLWFDDLYFPAQTMPPDYPMDTLERGLREWRACFTEGELLAMAEFHRVFSAVVDDLPMGEGFQRDPGWLRVSAAARRLLEIEIPGPAGGTFRFGAAPLLGSSNA